MNYLPKYVCELLGLSIVGPIGRSFVLDLPIYANSDMSVVVSQYDFTSSSDELSFLDLSKQDVWVILIKYKIDMLSKTIIAAFSNDLLESEEDFNEFYKDMKQRACQ